VDEAQGLTTHVLEEIRLLSNMELPNEKLLQIILVGQPELEAKLRRPDLRQLQQRIGLRCRTARLTLEEVAGYIENRLHTAGSNSNLVFEPEAIEAVHSYSGGIPRVINLLCENALINAYVEHTTVIPAALVAEATRDLQFDVARPVAPRLRAIGPPSDVPDLHSILAKIKADADSWHEKPRATPYLVSAQKAFINHQGDAFSAGDAETTATRVSTPTSSRLAEPEYATARVRVWKRDAAKNFFSTNLASARALRAIANLRSSLEPAVSSIRKYDLEGKLRLYTHLARIHGVEPTVRSLRNLKLESRIRRSAKRVQVHGIQPAVRSFRRLDLDNRLKNCAKTFCNVTEPRLGRFSRTLGAGVKTGIHTARNGAAPLVESIRHWWVRNFNAEAYGRTLIASFLAGCLLMEILLRTNLAHALQHPGRIMIACVGILLGGLYLAAGVSILLRARHKLWADASDLLTRTLRWLRAPISPIPTRELSSVAGKIHRGA
jgi:hypothetical protein